MQEEQIKNFLKKFSSGVHTEDEHQQFINWLKTAAIEDVERIAEEYKAISVFNQSNSANPELVSQIEAALNQYELAKTTSAAHPHLDKGATIRRMWRRWAVAASIILAIGIGSYFLFFNKSADRSQQPTVATTHDVIAPQTNRATITTSDGKIIYLDSAANGTLAIQDNVQLVKLSDGQIEYSRESGVRSQELMYNTLSNRRGSKVIDMTLSDGSHVWLNAGSSITYPVAFVGNERKVSMTGEAYFEVVHNAAKPFTVSVNGIDVHDLGTSFNINGYTDEADTKITLLDGVVQVQSVILKPGQQAIATINNKPITINADVEQVIAWKNGLFKFDGSNVESVMKQIARWYDLDIVYEGEKPIANFRGTISRQQNISEVLKMLELTKAINFRVEEKKVIVSK